MDEKIELLNELLNKIGDIIPELQEKLILEEEAADLETLSGISEKLAVENLTPDKEEELKTQQEALKKKIEERREKTEEQRKRKETLQALGALKNPDTRKRLKEDIANL